MKKLLFTILMVVLYSCGKGGKENTVNADFIVEGDIIHVKEEALLLENIVSQKVYKSDFSAKFTTSGTVEAIPNKYAEVASPFAGRITQSFVRLGQKVSQGSPIFEISSPAFFEASKDYFQAKQEMELALKNLYREKDLLKNNVGVVKDVEEAEVNYELKKKDYENSLAALKVFSVNPEELKLGQPLIVRAPIAGEIVKNKIVLGQYIKEDADPMAVVADLSKVWVIAHVKEKDIYLIQHLDKVEVRLTAMPNQVINGTIYHISDLLEQDTRSVEVIIECENEMRLMKPFMYGTVELTDSPIKALFIPNSAILQGEESIYVIVREGKNKFRKTKIESIFSDENRTVVVSDLADGTEIVTEGAYYFIGIR